MYSTQLQRGQKAFAESDRSGKQSAGKIIIGAHKTPLIFSGGDKVMFEQYKTPGGIRPAHMQYTASPSYGN